MKYDVVNMQLSHPSFSWNNGLFAVIEKTETEYNLCKLDGDGKPSLYRDGKFMITCTGINNPEVYPTGMIFEHDSKNDNISKRIIYTASDSGIDGLGPRKIVYADYDEENLKQLVRVDKNKNWLTLGEIIVDIDLQTKKSLAKLDALDKLIIGI